MENNQACIRLTKQMYPACCKFADILKLFDIEENYKRKKAVDLVRDVPKMTLLPEGDCLQHGRRRVLELSAEQRSWLASHGIQRHSA